MAASDPPNTPCCSLGACSSRPLQIAQALRLEYLTVGWNVLEGIVAVAAARAAGSVALLGFGIDSFIECASALVMLWRLHSERLGQQNPLAIARLERRAQRLIALSLAGLALFVLLDALDTLLHAERPSFSVLGTCLLVASITVMSWLARQKRRLARALDSSALGADAFQTTACFYLSLAALLGVGANGLFGFWWADPLVALVISGLILSEARRVFRGQRCC